MDIAAERMDLAQRMKWNIGFWVAGFLFWSYAAAMGALYPLAAAKLLWLAGSCAIAPMGFAASFILRADPKAHSNSLATLITMAHLSGGMMCLPIIFAAFLYWPQIMILVMAIAFGIDFFVMAWAYDSPFPWVHAVVRTIAVSVIWFAAPDGRPTLLPAAVALCYLATMAFITVERPRWIARRTNQPKAPAACAHPMA